jgi:site-specific DNA-methyltransferase (adenine-specific)
MLDLLQDIKPQSIDSVVTDPPYELNFMNKGWDRSGIAFQPNTWKQCYEALKPGGYLLAFGGSRTFHRIAVAIEDAGFEIRDVIMWVYGSGFPKSLNIGLAVDKINGVESKVVSNGRSGKSSHAFQSEETTTAGEYEIKEAQNEWQGWGTALKPAYEPIIVARKPLKGTVAQNVLAYGVGGINIDECRVGGEERTYDLTMTSGNFETTNGGKNIKSGEVTVNGRFPANFIHNGSDEVVSLFPNSDGAGGSTPQSKIAGYGKNISNGSYEYYGGDRNTFDSGSGSASRFFYTAKASKKDRDEGLKLFEVGKVGHGNLGNSKGLERFDTLGKNIHPTVKPCELMQYLVRMVTPKGGVVLDPFMGSGSTGKAVMFENRERQANYKFIGIDLDLDNQYCDIANGRIDYALNKFEYDEQEIRNEDKEKGQLSIFDFMGE